MKKIIKLVIMGTLFSTIGNLSAQDVFSHKFGTLEVDLLSEGQREGNTSILIDASPEVIKKYAPNQTFPNAINAFLIRTPEGKNILIDTGYGVKLFDNMKFSGVTTQQINILLITHMHPDHIGGLLKDGQVMFPNTEIYLAKPEHDYWMSDVEMNKVPENRRNGFDGARAVILAYKDKLHLFEPSEIGDKANELIPGVQAFAAYGHTPGHTAFLFESGKDKVLIWGDLTHAMDIQMPHPEIGVIYDTDPKKAITSRKQILAFVAKNHIPIAGMHIAFPGMGTISPDSKNGYLYTPTK